MRRRHGEQGQALVEFVLLFPFMLILILFVVEFGFAMYSHITVNQSAREAARYAAVAEMPNAACTAGSIEERAIIHSSNVLVCGEVTVGYLDPNVDGIYGRGDEVVVRIDHTYNTQTPLGALMSAFSFGVIPASFQMTACSDTRLEGPPANQGALAAAAGDCST